MNALRLAAITVKAAKGIKAGTPASLLVDLSVQIIEKLIERHKFNRKMNRLAKELLSIVVAKNFYEIMFDNEKPEVKQEIMRALILEDKPLLAKIIEKEIAIILDIEAKKQKD